MNTSPIKEDSKAILTPFPSLNTLLGSGLLPGQLVVIAGRPAMGKTALGLDIITHVTKDTDRVAALFSLEMSLEMIQKRLSIAHPEGLNSQFCIDDSWDLSVGEIHDRCKAVKDAQGKLDLVLIDYIELLVGPVPGNVSPSRSDELDYFAKSLKRIAKRLQCPVIAFAQLTRATDCRSDRRPLISDLRDKDSLVQNADVLLFLYRDGYYYKDSPEKDVAEIIVAKNRMGSTGTAKIQYDSKAIRFHA
jgi:replicative DNA helicase